MLSREALHSKLPPFSHSLGAKTPRETPPHHLLQLPLPDHNLYPHDAGRGRHRRGSSICGGSAFTSPMAFLFWIIKQLPITRLLCLLMRKDGAKHSCNLN
ncbi:hypothetical protein HPP92_007578 [Vanilla planifolia]|uniref:Uncharacterized protein n=1 Tax=Vanilla planifolia TaxID=51239 RepID=A0A835REB2_VANPL|nr:hypothetical protein HPP92_007578 [Vanilla planifolia]